MTNIHNIHLHKQLELLNNWEEHDKTDFLVMPAITDPENKYYIITYTGDRHNNSLIVMLDKDEMLGEVCDIIDNGGSVTIYNFEVIAND